MEPKKTFERIISFEQFRDLKNLKPGTVGIVETNNGKIMMSAYGQPIATIHRDLKGANAEETIANIAAINSAICFGIPKEGTLDQAGRPSLPCCMESKSQWKEVAFF